MDLKKAKVVEILSEFDLEEYKDDFFHIGVDTVSRLKDIDHNIYEQLCKVIVLHGHRNSLNKLIRTHSSFVPIVTAEPISSKKRNRGEPAPLIILPDDEDDIEDENDDENEEISSDVGVDHVIKFVKEFWDKGSYASYLLNSEKTNLHKD
jgi:hypothetical protein